MPQGEKWALRHVSVTFPSQGLFAVKGASGSGKSTFLNLCSLLEKPTEGRILFQGQDLAELSKKEVEDYRSFSCGFVYQHFNLLEDLTAQENVSLPLRLRGEKEKAASLRSDVLFEAFGLTDLKEKKVSLLSGGEKQRIAILRALSSSPSVLFCDEPTGALDHENEIKVMTVLKDISESRLVLLVSHNERIIQEYSDGVLTLEEGRLLSIEGVFAGDNERPSEEKTRGKSHQWVFSLLRRNYQQDALKNVLAYLSGVVGYLSLLLSFGFYSGSAQTLQEEKKQNLQYLNASLSYLRHYPIEGSPLSLVQASRPSYDEAKELVKAIPDVSVNPDYGYFFPSYSAFSLNGEKEEPTSFLPIFDLTLRERTSVLPLLGEAPRNNDLATVLVNTQFADQFPESPLGKTITLQKHCLVEKEGKEQELSYSFSLYISGIIEEFSFLNIPKVYYSYAGASIFFDACYLPSLAKEGEDPLSVNEFLEREEGGSLYANYDYLVFAHNERSAEQLKELSFSLAATGSSYSLSSLAYATESAFSSLSSSFSMSLLPFLLVEVLGVAFILGSLAYSSFLERKKEAAILWALGARHSETSFLYEGGSLWTSLLSALSALVLSFPAERFLSALFLKTLHIPGLIRIPYEEYLGIPFLPILALFCFAVITSLSGASLPLTLAMRANLAEELRDE